jgi:hypothetical protein
MMCVMLKALSAYCNASPSRLPHHQCADPGTDSLGRPHLRINSADLVEDSCPGQISDPVLAPSRTRISSPPSIAREQRPNVPHTKHNPTCARAMGQDWKNSQKSWKFFVFCFVSGSIEAELISTTYCVAEVKFIRRLVTELGFVQRSPTPLLLTRRVYPTHLHLI